MTRATSLPFLLTSCLVGCATGTEADRCQGGVEPSRVAGSPVTDRWGPTGTPITASPGLRFDRAVAPGTSPSVDTTFTGTAKYAIGGGSAGPFAAIPGALVTGIRCLSPDRAAVAQPDTRTDGNGRYVVGCPPAHPEATGTVVLSSDVVTVTAGGDTPVAASFAASSDPILPRPAARAFVAAGYVGPIARQRFGQPRPSVRIALDVPGVAAFSGRYTPETDRVEFGSGALDGFDGEEAFYQVAHEYGHAYHQVAIEPWATYQCIGGTHAFHRPNTLSCAFVEGFAHFFAAWIGGDRLDTDEAGPNYGSDRVFEENLYRTFQVDGSRTPGVVAAFLYDLADDADSPDGADNTSNGDEDFDQLAVPGAEIARVMRQCRLGPAATGCPAVTALDGIDQFVYCAEGAVGANLGRQWRSYQSVDGGGGAGPWNPPFLRPLWERNLFPVD